MGILLYSAYTFDSYTCLSQQSKIMHNPTFGLKKKLGIGIYSGPSIKAQITLIISPLYLCPSTFNDKVVCMAPEGVPPAIIMPK